MKKIGGNTKATFSVLTITTNDIGEQVKAWTNVKTVAGWLDLVTGEAKAATFNAKIQESTHVFVSDYVKLPESVTSETARMTIAGKHYEVKLIDDPLNLHEHWEIFLKFTGGQ